MERVFPARAIFKSPGRFSLFAFGAWSCGDALVTFMPDCSTSKGWHTAFTVKLVHVGFAVTGMFMVLFGPSLPTLTRHWSLDDARAGYFFLAQFLGGVHQCPRGISNTGRRLPWSLVLGFSCMGLGTIFLASGPWALALVLAFIMGSGRFLTTAINLWIRSCDTRTVGSISLVNFSWSAGAVACPFLVYFWQESLLALSFFQLLGCAAALLAIAFALLPRDALPFRQGHAATPPPVARNAIDAFAFVFGLLIFLYVGAKRPSAAGLRRMRGAGRRSQHEALGRHTVVLLGRKMLGRILGPAILRRIGNLRAFRPVSWYASWVRHF